ncbi:MAG: hypothetical protein EOO46_20720 [Flavobacterium sp.]|nr:MAG: hypothetical protein EOO46_20720 [Flavobacterium sp.]
MRLIFFALLFLTNLMNTFGQSKPDSSKHLVFKGVPIDGTLEVYVSKMKESGFTLKGSRDGTAVLAGDFASYKDCSVEVSTLKQKNLVSKIAVKFPGREDWSSLSSNYFELKKLLTEKYGEPADFEETFQSYEPRDDGSKFHHVLLGSCKYYSTYETPKGAIRLSIENDDRRTGFIKLVYSDKVNSQVIKKDALDDL